MQIQNLWEVLIYKYKEDVILTKLLNRNLKYLILGRERESLVICNSYNFSPTLIFHVMISLVSCYKTIRSITPICLNFQWRIGMLKNKIIKWNKQITSAVTIWNARNTWKWSSNWERPLWPPNFCAPKHCMCCPLKTIHGCYCQRIGAISTIANTERFSRSCRKILKGKKRINTLIFNVHSTIQNYCQHY